MGLGSQGARGIAIDSTGRIYIADTGAHRVRRFTSFGEPDRSWGTEGHITYGPVSSLLVLEDRVVAAGDKHLLLLDLTGNVMKRVLPVGYTGSLARGPGRTILMSDAPSSRMWVLDFDLNTIGRLFGSDGSEEVVTQPRGAVVSPDARLYVVNEIRISPYEVGWRSLAGEHGLQ
jgi:hypothetical protein